MGQNARRFRVSRWKLFDDSGMSADLRKSLYWVIWGVTVGMFGSVVTTGAVWSGFQREVLGANDFQLGLIAAIPVAMNVSQLIISYFMERQRNRRFIFLFYGIIGRILWVPIGLLPVLCPGLVGDTRIWIVILLVTLIAGGNSFVTIAFGSLMGDLVPIRIRGQYFAARQRVYLALGVVCGLLVAYMVDTMGVSGYSLVLVLGGVSTTLDIVCFFFVTWPAMGETNAAADRTPFFKMLLEVFRNRPFLRIVLFYTVFFFGVNVAAPFYNVYMIEYLRMSFTEITLFTQIISNVMTVLVVTRWGRMMDRYGCKPMLRLSCIVCCVSVLPWVFATPQATYCVLLSNVMSGIFWPGLDLCQQNLYLGQSPRTHRSMYVAVYFAFVNLFGVALGNAVGGYLMQDAFVRLATRGFSFLGMPLTHNSQFVFLLTSLLRTVATVLLIPLIQEEGAWTLRATLRDAWREWKRDVGLRHAQIRAYRQRKQARKALDAMPPKEESKDE